MRSRPIFVLLHLALLIALVWLASDLTREPSVIPHVQAEPSPDAQPGKRLTPARGIPVFRLA